MGARITSCDAEHSGTWTCHLTREHGYEGWILWQPDRKAPFSVPRDWAVHRLRDLGGNQRDLAAGQEIEIGPLPILLERAAE